jgi:hypothetical protein
MDRRRILRRLNRADFVVAECLQSVKAGLRLSQAVRVVRVQANILFKLLSLFGRVLVNSPGVTSIEAIQRFLWIQLDSPRKFLDGFLRVYSRHRKLSQSEVSSGILRVDSDRLFVKRLGLRKVSPSELDLSAECDRFRILRLAG